MYSLSILKSPKRLVSYAASKQVDFCFNKYMFYNNQKEDKGEKRKSYILLKLTF